jgi:hypothetical protein
VGVSAVGAGKRHHQEEQIWSPGIAEMRYHRRQAVSTLKRGNMSYQRGALRKVRRKAGEKWVLRYRVTGADGRRVENTLPVGLVRDFPKVKDAWREVDRLGLPVRINDASSDVRIRFNALAEFYLKADSARLQSGQNPSTQFPLPSISSATT